MHNFKNVLIIENQSLIIDSFKKAFRAISNSQNTRFKIVAEKNCLDALYKIRKVTNNKVFDLILLNINIPPSSSKKVIFADDLAIELREKSTKTKIITFATACDNYRINNILKTINPEAILVNTDINFEELILAIKTVLQEPPYYSKTILDFIRKHIKNDFIIDSIDRQILYYLSKGTKMKDLPKMVCLSASAIEKRKRLLKQVFKAEKITDQILIRIAQEKGFI